MRRYYCSLSLILFLPLQAFPQETLNLSIRDQLDRPYVDLFGLTGPPYSQDEVKLLRSTVEEDRKQQIENCQRDEKSLQRQLDSAREGLKALNESAPRDTGDMANTRNHLHVEIAALEQVLRDKAGECNDAIPAKFQVKLAKVYLLEHWPYRREQTIDIIENGRARERAHGDVDDIGFRKLVDDQDKDVALGEQAFRQMVSSGRLPAEIQDPSVRQYVQGLAGRITRNSDLRVPLHVTVLDSPEISTVALPGGFIVLTSGLLLACETEAELAGIVSQQIAQIAARHATRSSTTRAISKVFFPALQIVTGLFTAGVSNAGAYYGMSYGFQGLGLLADRVMANSNGKAQKEADQLGIQYAWKAGFDPRGLIAFLDSIGKRKDYARTQESISKDPPIGERLIDAFTEIQYLASGESYAVDSADFRRAKELLQDPHRTP